MVFGCGWVSSHIARIEILDISVVEALKKGNALLTTCNTIATWTRFVWDIGFLGTWPIHVAFSCLELFARVGFRKGEPVH